MLFCVLLGRIWKGFILGCHEMYSHNFGASFISTSKCHSYQTNGGHLAFSLLCRVSDGILLASVHQCACRKRTCPHCARCPTQTFLHSLMVWQATCHENCNTYQCCICVSMWWFLEVGFLCVFFPKRPCSLGSLPWDCRIGDRVFEFGTVGVAFCGLPLPSVASRCHSRSDSLQIFFDSAFGRILFEWPWAQLPVGFPLSCFQFRVRSYSIQFLHFGIWAYSLQTSSIRHSSNSLQTSPIQRFVRFP